MRCGLEQREREIVRKRTCDNRSPIVHKLESRVTQHLPTRLQNPFLHLRVQHPQTRRRHQPNTRLPPALPRDPPFREFHQLRNRPARPIRILRERRQPRIHAHRGQTLLPELQRHPRPILKHVHPGPSAPAVDDDLVPETTLRGGERIVGQEEEERERENDEEDGREGTRWRGLRVASEEVGGPCFDRIHFVVAI